MSTELTGWALEQAHQQQRALGYVSLLQQALHTPDADYRRILSDFEALAGVIACIKRAGENLAWETPVRGPIQVPKKIDVTPREVKPLGRVEAEDNIIPMAIIPMAGI